MKQLKVLFLAADPFKQNALSLDEEIREIDQKVRQSTHRGISLVSAWAVRPDDLRSELLRHEPDVVHFSGHGTDSGHLVLQGNDGQARNVSTKAVADLLSHFKSTVKLVVLNACFSSTEAKAMTRHLDFAVGMNAAIGDEAAICFSAAFYETLASGRTVQKAFELGCNAVALRGLNEHTKPRLYVRKGLSADSVLAAASDDVGGNAPTGGTQSESPSPSPVAAKRSVFLSPPMIAGYFAIVAAIIGIIPAVWRPDRHDSRVPVPTNSSVPFVSIQEPLTPVVSGTAPGNNHYMLGIGPTIRSGPTTPGPVGYLLPAREGRIPLYIGDSKCLPAATDEHTLYATKPPKAPWMRVAGYLLGVNEEPMKGRARVMVWRGDGVGSTFPLLYVNLTVTPGHGFTHIGYLVGDAPAGSSSQIVATKEPEAKLLPAVECKNDYWGFVYDDSNDQARWLANVQALVSASLDRKEVGVVSGSASNTDTGVSFCARVCQADPARSELYIGIWDSEFVAGKWASEIAVRISGLQETPSFSNVVFRDEYGMVRFVASETDSGGRLIGSLYFSNDVLILDGTNLPANGAVTRLGAFSIRRERFFRCN